MPTSIFLLHRLPVGQQPSASDVDAVQQAIDTLCPVPAGGRRGTNITVAATLTMLKQRTVEDAQIAKADAMKDMWVVQVVGSDNRYLLPKGLPHVIEADARARVLLEKRMGYRTGTGMMLKARNYSLGDRSSDVMVRVLQLVQSPSLPPQGVALELVYQPTSDLSISSTVLQELAGAVVAALPPDTPGSLEVFTPSYSTYAAHLPATYGSHHLAVAYLQVALALAKGRG